ncbi:SAM-dependent methyltransferase [Nocardia sp. NPDC052316]|uniref:SAM-dependent methyltransferase n=1 Tax=Nocardia sp. NPDC052316 TaxID=3364329 RepID=UPI0037C832B2
MSTLNTVRQVDMCHYSRKLESSSSRDSAVARASGAEVIDYYEAKTAAIIQKYGPGPRVHFHVGYFDPPSSPEPAMGSSELQSCLVAAQERLIAVAVDRWAELTELGPRVLDAGCGLGGASLWWAEKLGCQVTALTCVAEHARLISQWAQHSELAAVRAVVDDVHDFVDPHPYDIAMAWEAACYFDRARWFTGLRKLLKPSGWVLIEDVFVDDSSWKSDFDKYWRTDVGSVRDYELAASGAGFQLVDNVDLTFPTKAFWEWGAAWTERQEAVSGSDAARLRASIAAHRRMRLAWECGGLQIRLLAFERIG